ncbi:contactin 6 [Cichlidogyrus casuarinus]|uniref:Contactin 6 n=1 Tax=Cichlidogyrus casuarinus TaxID=1844966 RepID=A0ABD2Q6G4_9PLAT
MHAQISPSSQKYAILGSGSLKILDLHLSDEGLYQCYPTRQNARLLIHQFNATIRASHSPVMARVGRTVSFHCEVPIVSEDLHFEWYLNGEPVEEKDGASREEQIYRPVLTRSLLRLTQLHEHDSGSVQCFVVKGLRSIAEATFELYVTNIKAAPRTQLLVADAQRIAPDEPGPIKVVSVDDSVVNLKWELPRDAPEARLSYFLQIGEAQSEKFVSTRHFYT